MHQALRKPQVAVTNADPDLTVHLEPIPEFDTTNLPIELCEIPEFDKDTP